MWNISHMDSQGLKQEGQPTKEGSKHRMQIKKLRLFILGKNSPATDWHICNDLDNSIYVLAHGGAALTLNFHRDHSSMGL